MNLTAQRMDLEKRCAVGEGLSAPIQKIPTEILEKIFVQSLPHFVWEYSEPHLYDDPLDFFPQNPHDARGRLGEVCRKWKIVTETAPRLWSEIILDGPLPSDIGIVDTWLTRSQSCPLDLYIEPNSWFKGDDQSRLQDLFLRLRREIPRLRGFVIKLECYDEIHRLFPFDLVTEAPNMELFGVLCDDTVQHADEDAIVGGSINAPKLRSIRDLGGKFQAFTPTTYSTLQRLTIRVPSKASNFYLPTLALCGNLEFLHWTECDDRVVDYIVGRLHPRVMLSALKQMAFSTADAESPPDFFDSIRAPALERLKYDPSSNLPAIFHPPAAGMLRLLLKDSFSSLRELDLWNATLSGPETMELFNQLVSLHTIFMFDCCLEAPFFDALNPRTNTFAAACPRLVKLSIVDCQFPIFNLVDFIQHRTQPDVEERSPGYLTTVEVEAYSRKVEHASILRALQQTHGSTLRLELRVRFGPFVSGAVLIVVSTLVHESIYRIKRASTIGRVEYCAAYQLLVNSTSTKRGWYLFNHA